VRLAFLLLGARLDVACGGAGFAPSSRFEIPARRELVLGLHSRSAGIAASRREESIAVTDDRMMTRLSVRERVRPLER
jgi:hypothetical protein